MQKWDFETDQKRFQDIFRDPTQIFRDPRFLRYHSPPLSAVVPTLPLLVGDLRFFASSPALPLWYINVPLFTSTVNIEYLVKNKTDLVWDLAHF